VQIIKLGDILPGKSENTELNQWVMNKSGATTGATV
jgi:hypothetical protein